MLKDTRAPFDRPFLDGKIQHRGGALPIVKELFDSIGSEQDAGVFNFASDSITNRIEIKIMQKVRGDTA